MENIKIPENTTGCRACKEAIDFVKEKIEKKENFIIACVYEKGFPHYHAPVSLVQMEKLNVLYKLLT
jgi:hypothetical protein